MTSLPTSPFTVQLPAGGLLTLNDAEEVALWDGSAKRAIEDYGLHKTNDLILLGAILTQQLAMYRAQLAMADARRANAARETVTKAAAEIRDLEKALGIDKKSREQGGQHTTADYITRLKRAGRLMGIHIAERTKAYESLANELRWRIRLLRNGDDEDRVYHGITPESIIGYAEQELAELERQEKEWAKEKGRLFVGRL